MLVHAGFFQQPRLLGRGCGIRFGDIIRDLDGERMNGDSTDDADGRGTAAGTLDCVSTRFTNGEAMMPARRATPTYSGRQGMIS